MPSTNVPGLWLGDQNTKIPSLSHLLSYKVNLSAANTTQTIVIPTTYQNPAQVVLPGPAPSGEPPQGKRFFATHLVVRDANGPIGGTAGGSVALLDQTTGVTVGSVASPTSAGANPVANIGALTQLPANGAINPNDTLAVVYTQPTTANSTTGTIFTLDVFGYWQQNV
jgi:hypothetical protein